MKLDKKLLKMGFKYCEFSDEYALNLYDEIEPTKSKDEVYLTVCKNTNQVSIDVFHGKKGWQNLTLLKIYNNKQLRKLINALNGY